MPDGRRTSNGWGGTNVRPRSRCLCPRSAAKPHERHAMPGPRGPVEHPIRVSILWRTETAGTQLRHQASSARGTGNRVPGFFNYSSASRTARPVPSRHPVPVPVPSACSAAAILPVPVPRPRPSSPASSSSPSPTPDAIRPPLLASLAETETETENGRETTPHADLHGERAGEREREGILSLSLRPPPGPPPRP